METQTLDYNNSYTTSQTSNIGESEEEKQVEALDAPCSRGLGIDHGLITEIEAYQGLMLDFEREFSDFLSSDLPKCPTEDSQNNDDCDELNDNNSATSRNRGDRRRSSAVTSSRSSVDGANDSGSLAGINYNFDGTISCCDISYDLLVS